MELCETVNSRHYRTETPNIVFELGLGPQEGWLYLHLRRVCGDGGECWKGTRTLARDTGMSVGMVSQAKKELKRRGLITIIEGDQKKSESDEIRIVSLWQRNHDYFEARKQSKEKAHLRAVADTLKDNTPPRSQYEHPRSDPFRL